MNITKNITEVNFSKGNTGREWIVVHYTGNKTDTPENNAKYFKTVKRGASAHYFVGGSDVVQCVEETDSAWAVGKNYNNGRLFGTCKNSNSISVEMCSTNSQITDETMQTTAELIRTLMNRYNISSDHVVRHYDVCGKACPGWAGWLPGNEDQWNKLLSYVNGNTKEAERVVEINCTSLRKRAGAGTNYVQVGSAKRGERYTIDKTSGNWGHIKGTNAWISLEYVKEPAKLTRVRINCSSLRKRSGPSTNFKQVGGASRGEVYSIDTKTNGWGRIAGTSQWICLKYTVEV